MYGECLVYKGRVGYLSNYVDAAQVLQSRLGWYVPPSVMFTKRPTLPYHR